MISDIRQMRPILLSILLLLTACASRAEPGANAISPGAAPALPVMPQQVGTFRIIETHRFPDPALGMAYRYRGPSPLQPDVYLYPMDETTRQAGPEAVQQARAESEPFSAALEVLRMQRQFDAFEVVGEQALQYTAGPHRIEGWHVHAVLRRGGEQRDTHQHILVLGDQMVKVRTSFSRGTVPAAELNGFLQGLVEGLFAR